MTERPALLSFIVPPHSESFGLGRKLDPSAYLERLTEYMRAAERIGVVGAFVYDFPTALDPWLLAYDVLANSTELQPVVAVRPRQESPESVGRRVADLGYRFGRPTHVNVVAGATRPSRDANDLEDKVAARKYLAEWASELRADLRPRLETADEQPILVTPSSRTPGVVPADCVLMMARPRDVLAEDIKRVREEQGVDRIAMLAGLVVRDTEEKAWTAATELYAPDRRQQIAGRMFMSQVVSSEHLASYALAEENDVHDERLWYGAPARGIDAPKLVGSAGNAAEWLNSCREIGVTDLIIDLVPDPAEYEYMRDVVAPWTSPH